MLGGCGCGVAPLQHWNLGLRAAPGGGVARERPGGSWAVQVLTNRPLAGLVGGSWAFQVALSSRTQPFFMPSSSPIMPSF